ncbi:putative B3 domain-containing protein At1g78640 [Cicer arietinum]|nr:putative B3 domain-containing protein At1g78640 [Cicer arietinum]
MSSGNVCVCSSQSSFCSSNVCLHLSLHCCCPFPCSTETKPTKKRKRVHQETLHVSRKNKTWGYSTDLMLYDDPWKIKKVLEQSDVGPLSRLMLNSDLVKHFVLPVLCADLENTDDVVWKVENTKGVPVKIWDLDTKSFHFLNFHRYNNSTKSYIFNGSWIPEFVSRRHLHKGDEIGLHWDPYRQCFDFSVLRAAN